MIMQVKKVGVSALWALVFALAPFGVWGCGAGVQAKTTPDNPPLDMPAPPPRDVEPTEIETPQPVPLPQEPARRAPRSQPREPARPAEPPRPAAEPPKTETPAVEAPKPATPPPANEEPPKPPTTLQTTPSAAEGDLERTIRSTITRANGDLMRVDYRTLNSDARTQYDYAKRYIRQAEEAIRAKNLLFARTLADKAAVVAAQLAGR
jgi:outer membrane biosynthesis protein TonB